MNRLIMAVDSEGVPSASDGTPTISLAGCQSAMMRSMPLQSGPAGLLATTPMALADLVTCWPTATPMRRSPKSKAMIVCGLSSGVPGMSRYAADVDTERTRRVGPSVSKRHVENEFLAGGDTEPGIFEHFGFELAGVPARIAKCDQ